jgi:hypothetical protein
VVICFFVALGIERVDRKFFSRFTKLFVFGEA